MRNSLSPSQLQAMNILSTAVVDIRSCQEDDLANTLNRILCDYVKGCTDQARAASE